MLLECKHLKKHFPIRTGSFGQNKIVVKAVDDVSLEIKQGESLSIVGESGCGKTTLARMLLQLLPISDGSIVFMGNEMNGARKELLRKFRKNVQIVFQDPFSSLDPRYSVGDIIKEAMTLGKVLYKSREEKDERVVSLLSSVRLKGDMLNRYPHEFSGGERQRIAIARALAINPKLLVLDEAVSSLDVIVQKQILDLLVDLKKTHNLTYIFISHNLKVVRKVSNRIAVMYKGKIVELANTNEIFNNPLHAYTKELLSAALNYQCISREKEIVISDQETLIDQGNEHYLLQ